jgi:hypothetical protein
MSVFTLNDIFMKKAGTLITILTLLCLSTYAQRHSDLGLTLNSPATGSTVPSLQYVNFNMTVKNLGADSIKTTDSLGLYMYIGNDTFAIFVNGQVQTYRLYTGITIKAGDSLAISVPMVFDTSFNNITFNLCWAIGILPKVADPIYDTVHTNNACCTILTVKKAPNSVAIVNRDVAVEVYPNPAKDFINFRISGQGQSHVRVQLMNAIGQLMRQQEKETGTLISVNTTGLPGGMYYYVLSTDQPSPITGRFIIDK